MFKKLRCKHKRTALVKRGMYGFDGWNTWENRYYLCKDCLKISCHDWHGHLSAEEFYDKNIGTIFGNEGSGDE